MARARSIKPGFFKNEGLSELPMSARLLFAGLWTIADRAGRLEYRPKRIKAEVFPYDSIRVEPLLGELEKAGFILIYQVDGNKYISIPTWDKHQNPHVREAASTIPAPGEHSASPEKAVSSRADSLNPVTDSLNPEPHHPVLARSVPIMDEQWQELRAVARNVGLQVSEVDWGEAYHEWRRMDPEQKRAAIDGLEARAATDDPALESLPKNYLGKRMWQRKIRVTSTRKPTAAEQRDLETRRLLEEQIGGGNA